MKKNPINRVFIPIVLAFLFLLEACQKEHTIPITPEANLQVKSLNKLLPEVETTTIVSIQDNQVKELLASSELIESKINFKNAIFYKIKFKGFSSLSGLHIVFDGTDSTSKDLFYVVDLVTKMNEEGIKPELEVFDVGMVNYAKYLIQKGLLKPPYYFNIILGNLFSAQNNPADLSSIIQALPPNSYYTIGGIGNYQLGSNIAGILYASGIRVGLEDNLYYDAQRKEKATNLSLIKRIVSICDVYERPRYTAKELRELLQIPLKI